MYVPTMNVPKELFLPLTSAHRYLLLVINHNQKSLPPDFHPEGYFLLPNLGESPMDVRVSAQIEKKFTFSVIKKN